MHLSPIPFQHQEDGRRRLRDLLAMCGSPITTYSLPMHARCTTTKRNKNMACEEDGRIRDSKSIELKNRLNSILGAGHLFWMLGNNSQKCETDQAVKGAQRGYPDPANVP